MADPERQVRIMKNGNLELINPATNATLRSIPFDGRIMKGCSAFAPASVQSQQGGTVKMTPLQTLFSYGQFRAPDFTGPMHMVHNPKLPDSGYEIELRPGQPFPKEQHFDMYCIFTVDLSKLDAKLANAQLANKKESPIRVQVKLSKPWGQEDLTYELKDDEIPLYPWDPDTFDFATRCPLTGMTPPKPLAKIIKNGDKTKMTAAWVVSGGTLNKTL